MSCAYMTKKTRIISPVSPFTETIMDKSILTSCICLFLVCFIATGEAVRCYQCSSGQDNEGEDNCGAYRTFDTDRHIAIECNSEESHMPGSFCMKVTQQSPRGFIWDGRWRQVIRRCASVADTGVTGVCNWGVYDNGVYWEECYCSENECNNSNRLNVSIGFALLSTIVTALMKFY